MNAPLVETKTLIALVPKFDKHDTRALPYYEAINFYKRL